MTQTLDEPVSVVVTYNAHKHRTMPRIMEWRNRVYKFSKLGFQHPVRAGRRLIHVFSVSDEVLMYRLELDTENLMWRLKEISDGLPD
ncbi:hypothetical protein HY441_00425 [Candidatus Microgenomates bacterium]|nr:hypothetical protein [Candidatus Microgenomates bacterium]